MYMLQWYQWGGGGGGGGRGEWGSGNLNYSVIAVVIMLCLYRPSSFIYFPFSVGPRTCIGKNFGMVRLVIAMKL